MHIPLGTHAFSGWLTQQIRLVEAWREELALSPQIDISTIERVERHYHWLCDQLRLAEASETDVQMLQPA